MLFWIREVILATFNFHYLDDIRILPDVSTASALSCLLDNLNSLGALLLF